VSAGVLPAVILVAVSLAGHLWAEAAGRALPRALLKALASSGMVAVALAGGIAGRYAQVILAGLLLSAAGDLCLLSRARRLFLAGVGAFLLAHLAYAAAFAPRATIRPAPAATLAVVAAGIVRWLWPHLGSMRAPVLAYTAAISVMLLLALGVADPLVRWGAALFYLSDLTVARDRFVRQAFANRLVGLPLYYAGQVLLALSAAASPGPVSG
jgi:uncharacterized membrane protein YhhN